MTTKSTPDTEVESLHYQIADLDDLTPGSVFVRADGSKRYVLFLANATLRGRKAEKFPQRVVFSNENGDVFDMTVNDFFRGTKFYNVEPDLERRLENLLVLVPSEAGTLDEAVAATLTLTTDDEQVDFGTDDEQVVASLTAVDESDSDLNEVLGDEPVHPGPALAFISAEGAKPPVPAEVLAALVTSYQQEPRFADKQVIHKITFGLPANISAEAIKQCFGLDGAEFTAYPLFELNADDFGSEARIVDWSDIIGGFRQYDKGVVSLQIVLGETVETTEDRVIHVVDVGGELTADQLDAVVEAFQAAPVAQTVGQLAPVAPVVQAAPTVQVAPVVQPAPIAHHGNHVHPVVQPAPVVHHAQPQVQVAAQ